MNIAIKPAYLELENVAAFVALSGTTVQRLVREDSFPKPRLLSGRRVAWLVRELEAWAEDRPVADLLPPKNTGARKQGAKAAPPAAQA